MFELTSPEFVYLFLTSSNFTIYSLQTNLSWVCVSSDACDVYTLDYDWYYLGYECDGTQTIDTQYSLLDNGLCISITVLGFEFAYDVLSFTDEFSTQ